MQHCVGVLETSVCFKPSQLFFIDVLMFSNSVVFPFESTVLYCLYVPPASLILRSTVKKSSRLDDICLTTTQSSTFSFLQVFFQTAYRFIDLNH